MSGSYVYVADSEVGLVVLEYEEGHNEYTYVRNEFFLTLILSGSCCFMIMIVVVVLTIRNRGTRKEKRWSRMKNRQAEIPNIRFDPFYLKVHELRMGEHGTRTYSIEVRPRAGRWAPFLCAIPLKEKDIVSPSMFHGPSNIVPAPGIVLNGKTGPSKEWWILSASDESTPFQSYYIFCNELPSRLIFGDEKGPHYERSFERVR